MTDNLDPEAAVRLYLLWLEDPSNLVDASAVKKAAAAVDKAKDPLEKLHALADLERAQTADASGIVADFITYAKAYADAQGIPASAFRQLGVPADLLVEAGLEAGSRRSRSGRPASGGAGSRAPKVPVERLQVAALELPGEFTLADVADRAGGGSPATVRKAVEGLVESGKVNKLGPMAGYTGRGRAPTVYSAA
jgi:hypothetical protein